MASIFKAASHPLFLILILFSASQFLVINCTEFEVGGRIGWVVPNSKDKDEMYNQWASQNRFKIDDTIRKYHFLPMKHEHFSFGYATVSETGTTLTLLMTLNYIVFFQIFIDVDVSVSVFVLHYFLLI
jgi:hypothetical protein